MQIYWVMVDPLDKMRAAGVSYSIHVFPKGYDGAVPARFYLDEAELVAALTKLKITDGTISRIRADLKGGKDHITQTLPLSDQEVAEFGWPLG